MTAGPLKIESIPTAIPLSPSEIVHQSFVLATKAQQAGNVGEAEQLYRAILAFDPAYAEALHGLGTLAHHLGRSDVAAGLIGQALVQRNDPMFHNNLGVALAALGKFTDAIAAHRRALELKPAYPEAFNALGNAQSKLGNLDEAIASYRQALALRLAYTDARSNLGKALRDKGELAAAEEAYEQVLERAPDCAEAHNNLGIVYRAQGRLDEAVASFDRALACRPAYAEAYNNQGNVFVAQEDYKKALESFELALTFKPDFSEALTGYGHVLQVFGNTDVAMASWRRAVSIEPQCFEALSFLGRQYSREYMPSEAIDVYEKALAIRPDSAETHSNIGTALLIAGRPEEALAAYERAIELAPDWPVARSNRIMAMQYVASQSIADILAAARDFGAMFDRPDPTPFDNALSVDRRLRIGYVSGDFIRHPVGLFLAPALDAHDTNAVETFCYSNNSKSDEVTEALRRSAHHWREIAKLSDFEAADLIRRDGIDILVDLSGHTDTNRLPLFGLKPAPVQAAWIGYFGTTGMATIDYVLLDPISAPAGAESGYSESVVRLPYGRFAVKAPDYAPDLVDPPCVPHGFVTFGSFNNVAKVGPDVIRVWAEILRANPEARLILKWMSLHEDGLRRRLLDAFAEAGVSPDRIELRGPSSHRDSMSEYGDIDIALDPFPFSGGLTTCDALWMGVPVVTLPGERLASRQTFSFLRQMGMDEGLVARSPEDYVALASALAADPARLRDLRQELRPAMAGAPFYDGAKFAAALEDAFRQMWRHHCSDEKPTSFDIAAAPDSH